jgi:hypothetical protein
MVSHGRVELLAHPLSQKYLQMKWNSYGKYFHLANVLFYSIFLFFVTCFSYEIMRHEEQPNVNSTVNLTHDVSTIGSFGTKNCGFFTGVRQPQQVQHFECQDNPSDVHECCGHHQLHNHQHHTGDDPDVPTKVYVFHGPHQSGHVDTLLGCDCHGPAHLLGYHVRTPVLLRVSYRVPQLVQSSPSSATLRPSRDLRGDVPRDITDTHQSTHGLLNPDHRVRTCLLHSIVKGEYLASLIDQYQSCFPGRPSLLQDHTHESGAHLLDDARRNRLSGYLRQAVLSHDRGGENVSALPNPRFLHPGTVHGTDAHPPHEPAHRFGRRGYRVGTQERTVEETRHAGSTRRFECFADRYQPGTDFCRWCCTPSSNENYRRCFWSASTRGN